MFAIFLQAQAEGILLRSEKIYSVLAIIILIFISLIGYLFFTDKKITKLENTIKAKQDSNKK
jgi:uncharacterized membrane protein (DUF106 family)